MNDEHLIRELAAELTLIASKLERIPPAKRGDIPGRMERAVLAISVANAKLWNIIHDDALPPSVVGPMTAATWAHAAAARIRALRGYVDDGRIYGRPVRLYLHADAAVDTDRGTDGVPVWHGATDNEQYVWCNTQAHKFGVGREAVR